MRNKSAWTNCIENNKGFSIVELIIAVAIFAIASVPLIQAFSRAGFTNRSAQFTQNATSVAEAAMEKIKAESLKELGGGGDNFYDTGTGKSPDFFAKESMTSDEIDACNSYLSGKRSLVQESEGFYVYHESDVSADGSEDKYEVVATIDTTESTTKEYSKGSVGDPYTDTDAADANSAVLPVLTQIDKEKNAAISTEINKYDDSAVTSLLELYYDTVSVGSVLDEGTNWNGDGAYTGDVTTVSNLKKTVTIKAETGTETTSDDSGNAVDKEIIEVNVYVSYSGEIAEGGTTKTISYKKPKTVYTASFDAAEKPDIYVFYKCMNEKLSAGTAAEETVEFTGDVFSDTSDDRIKNYLVFGNLYAENGSSSSYKYTSADSSVTEVINVNGTFTGAISSNSGTHVYESATGDYVYVVDVCVTKDGKVCAYLTSTKYE